MGNAHSAGKHSPPLRDCDLPLRLREIRPCSGGRGRSRLPARSVLLHISVCRGLHRRPAPSASRKISSDLGGQTQSAPTGLRFTAGLCKIPTVLGRFVNRPYGICVPPLGCVDFAERVIGRSLRVVHHICLYRFCGRAMCAPTSILPQFRCFHSAAFHNVISP